MNRMTEPRTPKAMREHIRILERRLSYATDKQILLLNKLIEAERRNDDARGKPCPACGGPLVSFATMNLRICGDCRGEFDWRLAPDQKPLVANNRVKN